MASDTPSMGFIAPSWNTVAHTPARPEDKDKNAETVSDLRQMFFPLSKYRSYNVETITTFVLLKLAARVMNNINNPNLINYHR